MRPIDSDDFVSERVSSFRWLTFSSIFALSGGPREKSGENKTPISLQCAALS